MTMRVSTVNAEQFRDAVFFSMSLHRFGNRAQVKDMEALAAYLALRINGGPAAVEGVSGSKANTKTTKVLLRSENLDKINTFLNESKDRLCGRFGKALPSRIKEGLFVVRKDLVQEFEDELRAAQTKLAAMVQDFIDQDYTQAINRARDNDVNGKDSAGKDVPPGLGPLFNPKDYPSTGKLAAMFSIEWQWLALGVPEDLPAALRAEAAAKLEKQMTDAAAEVGNALYAQLGEFLDHLVERLTPGDGDKPKVYRDSVIENVRNFCAVFEARNFLQDDRLAELVSKAKAVLEGVTPEKLRKYASVAENTRAQFTAIKAELDKAITERPGRVFDLDED